MAEGHAREAWGRQSHLMAVMVNLQIDTKKTPAVTPAMFNPFSAENENAKRVEDQNQKAVKLIAQAVARQEIANGRQ